MALLIFFFCISIFFSFLCSIWEAVILSITPNYIRKQLAEKNEVGKLLEEYKEDIDRPLSAILTLNTIAHTAGAIGVGSQASAVFANTTELIPGLSWEMVVATLMTLAILILSEIIPKTIGANNWRALAPFTTKCLKYLILILTPLVWVTQKITKSLKNEKNRSVLNRSDILAITIEGEEAGTLVESESKIIKNLIHLGNYKVTDIMTPRTVLALANEGEEVRHFYDNHPSIEFSRIPIYQDKEDMVTGIVLKADILTQLANGNDQIILKDLSRPVKTVSDQMPLTELFEILVHGKLHLVIVNDTYGSLVGIVTLEDLLETILGFEITDESDAVTDLQALARKKWQARAKDQGLIQD